MGGAEVSLSISNHQPRYRTIRQSQGELCEETIGAIGASGAPGAKLDDACARAGLDKIRDRLK